MSYFSSVQHNIYHATPSDFCNEFERGLMGGMNSQRSRLLEGESWGEMDEGRAFEAPLMV